MGVDLQVSYDLSLGCPAVQLEDLGEVILGGGGLGEHAAGFGSSAGGGVDQHGFLDSGQGVQQLPDAHGKAVLGGVAAHEVGDLQGEYAGEGVDADVVVGPVAHRGKGHHVRVFELAEAELGLGLGTVGGHHLGQGPVLVGGDQDAFAEHLGFQVGAGVVVNGPGQPVCGWGVAGQFPADDACGQGSLRIWVISASTLALGRRAWPRARTSASSDSFAFALARVWSNPRD